MGFAAGYGMAAICYVQVFYVCEFGESIEVWSFLYSFNFSCSELHSEILFQDDGFADVLYNAQWYNLPINYQMDIMHLINRKQNGTTITIGPFGTINRELFKIVSNYHFNEKYSHSFHSFAIYIFRLRIKCTLLSCFCSILLHKSMHVDLLLENPLALIGVLTVLS